MNLLGFPVFGFANDTVFKIGIILGNPPEASSSSNQEKLCIIEPMAIELLKKNPHIKIIYAYNNRSFLGTVKATQELLSQNIDLVLLPLISSQALAAKEILDVHKIPFLTSGTLDNLITDASISLSTLSSNQAQANALAKYANQHFKQAKILTLTNIADPYSTAMSSAFIAKLYQLDTNQKIRDYEFVHFDTDAILSAMQDIDVIFAPLYNPDIAYLYAALAKRDKPITIIGPDSIGARHEFFSVIGESKSHINLIYIKNWDNTVKGPNKNKFMAMQKSYCINNKASFLNSYSFDLMSLLGSVVNTEKFNSRKNIVQGLKNSNYINVLDGVKYQFNDNGFNNKPLYLYQVSDKSIKLLTKLYGN